MNTDYLQFFGVLILFFAILFLAYYISRYVARLQMGRGSKGNISVIEAISIGPNKTLQLVRVGGSYMVIGVSKDNITFIQDVDKESLVLDEGQSVIPFNSILNKFVQKDQTLQSHTGEEADEPFEKK
jgi:flagellar protein FliO/FliZ